MSELDQESIFTSFFFKDLFPHSFCSLMAEAGVHSLCSEDIIGC